MYFYSQNNKNDYCMEPICPKKYGTIPLLLTGIYFVFKIGMSLTSMI